MTQDVFLKAFSKPPAATEDVRLRAWLYRVATNACFNLVRARRESEPLVAEALTAAGDPYEQARTAALIETSLSGLNERYRAALVLKDLHGLDGRELAEVLEVSRPAADVLVHRARASFRRVFAGLAGGDAVAPANLALALPMLPVPAALQALPLPALHPPAPLREPYPRRPLGLSGRDRRRDGRGIRCRPGRRSPHQDRRGSRAPRRPWSPPARPWWPAAGSPPSSWRARTRPCRRLTPAPHRARSTTARPAAPAAGTCATRAGRAPARHRRRPRRAPRRRDRAPRRRRPRARRRRGRPRAATPRATHDAGTHDSTTAPAASSGATSTTSGTHDGEGAGHDDDALTRPRRRLSVDPCTPRRVRSRPVGE